MDQDTPTTPDDPEQPRTEQPHPQGTSQSMALAIIPQPAADLAPTPASDTSDPQPPTQTAVIDRFEGKWAVLLVGDDERTVPVLKSSLPKRVKRGQWLKVQIAGDEGDQILSAQIDHEATAAARQRIADKLALLRSGNYRE